MPRLTDDALNWMDWRVSEIKDIKSDRTKVYVNHITTNLCAWTWKTGDKDAEKLRKNIEQHEKDFYNETIE